MSSPLGSTKLLRSDGNFILWTIYLRFSLFIVGNILRGESYEEIAKLIGCSRVTVTRALNKFKHENIIDIVKGEIVIKAIVNLETYIRWK